MASYLKVSFSLQNRIMNEKFCLVSLFMNNDFSFIYCLIVFNVAFCLCMTFNKNIFSKIKKKWFSNFVNKPSPQSAQVPLANIGPDSLKTFPGTCKRNFLCLQMISFEFLRAASIGWTVLVSRAKHFVHMTRPGARDWPAVCFPRPISHTCMTFTTIRQVNKLYRVKFSQLFDLIFSMVFELFLCGLDRYIYLINLSYIIISIACHTMWILTHTFFSRRLFSQWIQLWHFKLVWMIAHERLEGNLRLQVPGKVFRESGRSIAPCILNYSDCYGSKSSKKRQ